MTSKLMTHKHFCINWKKWWFQKWPNTAKFFNWRFQPFGAEASTWENWLVWSLPNSRLDKIFVFIILVFFKFRPKFRKNGNFTFCDRKVAPVQFILSALQTSAPYRTKMQKNMFKFKWNFKNFRANISLTGTV